MRGLLYPSLNSLNSNETKFIRFKLRKSQTFLKRKIGVENKQLNMRTQQIFTAVYQKGFNDLKKFTTIPKNLEKNFQTILV